MIRVQSTNGNGESDGRSHQETLAVSLIESLGFEGAMHACRANSWDGVLRYVMSFDGAEGQPGM